MTGKLGKYTMLLAALVVAIVAIAAGLLVTLLKTSAERLDQQQQATESVIVRSVVKRQLAKLETNVTDYALWDDMYDRFQSGVDPQWDVENLGRYGAVTFQISDVLAFAANGALAYDYNAKADDAVPVAAVDLERLSALAVPLIAEGRAGKFRAVTGVVEFSGRPFYIAMHAIGVASEKRKAGRERPNFALVYLKPIDAAYLSTAAADFNLGGLSVARAGWMVALPGPAGSLSQFGLKWKPSQGGRAFIADSIGLLLAFAPVVAAMLIAIGFGWMAVVNHARASEMRSVEARATAAEETSRAKSLFIASMSHEFRTPLNAINGFAECIKTDMLSLGMPDKYRDYAGDIQASGQHLLRIVNNLLLFSKIEAKQHDASVEKVSLDEEVLSAMRMLKILAEQKRVRLTAQEIPRSLLVLADPQSLAQIIVNIVGNALKFSPPESEVSIELSILREAGACDLRIVDQGCGIPEKTLLQIGQPFVQAGGVYTRREQGTGLGLAICLKLAAQMGARLMIDSVEGKGTTVTLRLPLAGGAQSAPSGEVLREAAIAAA
jgi:signal transduction histidine kinase